MVTAACPVRQSAGLKPGGKLVPNPRRSTAPMRVTCAAHAGPAGLPKRGQQHAALGVLHVAGHYCSPHVLETARDALFLARLPCRAPRVDDPRDRRVRSRPLAPRPRAVAALLHQAAPSGGDGDGGLRCPIPRQRAPRPRDRALPLDRSGRIVGRAPVLARPRCTVHHLGWEASVRVHWSRKRSRCRRWGGLRAGPGLRRRCARARVGRGAAFPGYGRWVRHARWHAARVPSDRRRANDLGPPGTSFAPTRMRSAFWRWSFWEPWR
jgi:hypothetical protein